MNVMAGELRMSEGQADRFRLVEDRLAIEDVVCALPFHLDAREFDKVSMLFTADATFDYASLFGPEMASVQLEAFLTNVVGALPGFDSTQHLVSSFVIAVEGDEATARANVRATHCVGEACWLVEGRYRHALLRTQDGWKIRRFCLERIHEEGDRAVLAEASARAGTRGPLG